MGNYIPHMALRDHQPDILFQGDSLAHGRHRALAEADFLTRNIALELATMAQARSPARRGAGRVWILGAQARRRKVLADAAAYDRLIAERDQLARLFPLEGRVAG